MLHNRSLIIFALTGLMAGSADAYAQSDSPPWAPTHSLDLRGGNWVDCGDRPEFNGVRDMTILVSVRNPSTGWFAGTRVLVGRNTSPTRKQFSIQVRPVSTGYGLALCFADTPNTPAIQCRYVPSGYFIGRNFHQIAVTKEGTKLRAYLDAEEVPVVGDAPVPEYLTNVADVPLTWGGSDLLQAFIHSGAVVLDKALRLPEIRKVQGPGPGSGDMRQINPTWWWGFSEADPLPMIPPMVGDGACNVVPGSGVLSTFLPESRILPTDAVSSYRFRVTTSNEAGEPRRHTSMGGIVKLSDEELLACLARGSSHLSTNQDLQLVRSHDGGRTWPYSGKPWPGGYEVEEVLFDTNETARGCSLSLVDGGRVIALFTTRLNTPDGTYPERHIMSMYSDNGGRAWSMPVEAVRAGTQWSAMPGGGHLVPRSDGCYSAGFYKRDFVPGTQTSEGRYSAMMMTTCDFGESWAVTATIARDAAVNGRQFEEPQCGVLQDGRWMCLIRTDAPRQIWVSWSSDEGAMWTPVQPAFEGWNWPTWVQLQDSAGTIVAATRSPVAPYRGTITYSQDGGQTWAIPRDYQHPDGKANGGQSFIELRPGVAGLWHSQEMGPNNTTNSAARLEFMIVKPFWPDAP